MEKNFSTKWKASKQPRKQRKYVAKAPLHTKRKFMSVNLAKPLRKTNGKRNKVVRKGDVVKVMRGKFKKIQGKVLEVDVKRQKVFVDGIQTKKMDGAKVTVPLKPSNLQIIELGLEDKKRIKNKDKEVKKVKENAPEKTKNTK